MHAGDRRRAGLPADGRDAGDGGGTEDGSGAAGDGGGGVRLWSVHPRYLDRQGLTACWREGLLAQKVLTGTTRGYRNHPQLQRFRVAPDEGGERAAVPDGGVVGGVIDGAVVPGDGGVVGGAVVPGDGAVDAGAVALAGPGDAVTPGPVPPTRPEPVTPVYPGDAIVTYLHAVVDEAAARGYSFDRGKVLGAADPALRIEVSDGQLAHEWVHLAAKLATRSPEVAVRWADVVVPEPHPLFVVVPGPVAEWEIVTDGARPT